MKNCIVALVSLTVALACVFGIIKLEASIPAVTDTNTQTQTPAPAEVYTVRTYGDGIGVFAGDADEPILFYSADLSVYPDADLQMLREGIQVKSYKELRSLIEDYIG